MRKARRLWYWFLQLFLRLFGICFFQYRCFHSDRMRIDGPVLIMSNHQSHLDSMLVGIACHEPLHYLARKTLFRFAPFGWLISSLDAIPLNRDGMGIDGIKETLRRLKVGAKVVLFPEGRRTSNGQVARLRPGFCSLARRGSVTLLPVGIAGAFDAWPRSQKLPRLGKIHVCIGKPIHSDEIARYDDRQLVELVESRIRDCHATAQNTRARPKHST